MMYEFGNMMSGFAAGGFFAIITWVALMFFLVLGSIYFWKEIGRK